MLSIPDGHSNLVSEDASAFDPVWISKEEIAFFKPTDRGCTALMTQNVLDSPE